VAEISIHAAAEAESEPALAWYLARSPQAAAGFESAFEGALALIEQFPEAQPLCDDRHRYCSLRRYPYGVVYRVDGDRVRVVAVPHARQLPRNWGGRT
jgi:plasmid stabilization system protein ParE